MSLRETTCLVVDDSAVIRKVARRIIEDIGYAVIEARTATAPSTSAPPPCRT